jgi:hypothetical protein
MKRHLHTGPIGLAVACSIAISACGIASGPSSSAATGTAEAVKFATCMRSHGVPNFPDPGAPGGVRAIRKGPALEHAIQTCNKLLPTSQSTGRQFNAQQRAAALASARCIRDHGVPNFPDPTFPASGGELIPPAAGFDPSSPAFKQAAKACGINPAVGEPHGG